MNKKLLYLPLCVIGWHDWSPWNPTVAKGVTLYNIHQVSHCRICQQERTRKKDFISEVSSNPQL